MKRVNEVLDLIGGALVIGAVTILAWQGAVGGGAALATIVGVAAALGVYRKRG